MTLRKNLFYDKDIMYVQTNYAECIIQTYVLLLAVGTQLKELSQQVQPYLTEPTCQAKDHSHALLLTKLSVPLTSLF